ncbi:MAG TPA: glycosyltransferase family 4 protein [Candidatus Thermoplasmatota archaeon]|nr:glycosyltransferase family 4 protein [Candidatus Thermoplasmatota archaeon]
MIGWEFPPFLAGGLGIHCLELTTELSRKGVQIDFYMPHMASIEGNRRVADHHKHLRIIEVEADPEVLIQGGPYGGGGRQRGRGYEANFNDAVMQYNERLLNAFDSYDADVIHCHDWITVPAAVELKHRTGKPLVFTVHSTEYDRSAGFFPQNWIINLERLGIHEADAVIAVSGYTRDQLVERFRGDASKIFPIHNGVNYDKLPASVTKDYNKSNRTVLFLSRVSRQKGPIFFMEAARKVLDVDPSVRFIMAGKGEMLPEMIQFAVRNNMMDRMSFTGYVTDAEAFSLFQNSDVYVLPSVSEPFGISILEAMTSGIPTITSKTTGVGEALNHVLKAHYWDTWEMADMILRLLDSRALREELGRNGAREARKFTWDRCASATLDVYRWTADQARRRNNRALPASVSA